MYECMIRKNDLKQLEDFLMSIDLGPSDCCLHDDNSVALFIKCIDNLYAKFSKLYNFEYKTISSKKLADILESGNFFGSYPFSEDFFTWLDMMFEPFYSMKGFQVENFYSHSISMELVVDRFMTEHELPKTFEWLTNEKTFKDFSNYLSSIFNFISSYDLESVLKEFFEINTTYQTTDIEEIASKLVFSCKQDTSLKDTLYNDKKASMLVSSLIFGENDMFQQFPYFKDFYYNKIWLDADLDLCGYSIEFSHTVIRSKKWYVYINSTQEFKNAHKEISDMLEKCLYFIKEGFQYTLSVFEGVYLNEKHKTLDVQFASGYDCSCDAEFTCTNVYISVYFALIIAEPLLDEFIELHNMAAEDSTNLQIA